MQKRNVSIDLLRIVSMFMVLTLHFNMKGGFWESQNNIVNIESNVLVFISIVAVNCYVLISGYFLCDKPFQLKRVVNTYTQTWFYSVLTFAVLIAIKGMSFSYGSLLQSVLPFTFNNYWFVTNYIILLLITPILNSAINNMSKTKMKICLLVLAGLFCVYNTIVSPINPIDGTGGFGLIWFIVLYFTAAYFKKFYTSEKKSGKFFLLYSLLTIVGLFVFYFARFFGKEFICELLVKYNSINVYLQSVCLFLAFLNLEIKNNYLCRIIIKIAPLTFAVYLIHESIGFKTYLWKIINTNVSFLNNGFYFILETGFVFGIFGICILIEFIRAKLFEVLKLNQLITNISRKAQNSFLIFFKSNK